MIHHFSPPLKFFLFADGDRNLKLLSSDWNFIRSKTSSEMNHLLTFFVCWFSHTSNQDCIRERSTKYQTSLWLCLYLTWMCRVIFLLWCAHPRARNDCTCIFRTSGLAWNVSQILGAAALRRRLVSYLHRKRNGLKGNEKRPKWDG